MKYILLADIGLNINDEYSSFVDNVLLGIYDFETEQDAIKKANELLEDISDYEIKCCDSKINVYPLEDYINNQEGI